jgi:phage terminase large subunit
MNVNIDLTQIQKVILPHFYPLLFDKNRFLVLYGSAGSGKSVFAVHNLLIRILVGYKLGVTQRFLLVRKTASSIRESVYAEIKKWITAWNLNDLVIPNKSNLSFEFSNGSQIISVGVDDSEKLKSLSGITSIWIEEASQLSLQDFKQINLRLRGIDYTKMQIILTFNPISTLSWLRDYFFVNTKDTATINHSTWRNNPNLGEQYTQELVRLKDEDENYWKIYSEGLWGELKGLIYSNYQVVKEVPPKYKEIVWGLDFGYNHYSALTKVGYYDDNFYLDEQIYQTNLTNKDLIKALKEKIPLKDRRSQLIYADNAEPARIEEINREGFICKPADKSVSDGIDYCKRCKLKVTEYSSNLLKELQSYKYKEDKDGNTLEEPLKFNDHACDSFRYAIYTHYGKIRPKASISFL